MSNLFIRGRERLEHPRALVVKPPWLARFAAGKRVGRNQRQRHRRIDVAYDRIGQPFGIYLTPAYRFGRSGARQTARVGPRVRDLEEVVVPFFSDAQYFLDLRLGLQDEVLGRAAA